MMMPTTTTMVEGGWREGEREWEGAPGGCSRGFPWGMVLGIPLIGGVVWYVIEG